MNHNLIPSPGFEPRQEPSKGSVLPLHHKGSHHPMHILSTCKQVNKKKKINNRRKHYELVPKSITKNILYRSNLG